MPKIHFKKGNSQKTVCGKNPQGRGLNSAWIEYDEEKYFTHNKSDRCKICDNGVEKPKQARWAGGDLYDF